MAMGDFITKHFRASPQTGLPTAPTSPNIEGNEVEDISSLSDRLAETSIEQQKADPNALTPPVSSAASASSSTQTDCEDEPSGSRKNSKRSSFGRHLSGNDGIALPNRRLASGLNPLSAITSNPAVSAPQLSNPVSQRPSASPDSPANPSQEISAQSALVSCLENVKLTDGVASPRTKTPPRTPRALSNDGSESTRRSATAVATPRSNQSPARDPKNGNLPFRLPRGRLSVKISEARGLRPSYDPYAVCVYEWNESIARNEEKDAKSGVEMERDPSRGRESSLGGGVPVKRSASDMGRSMAIPMKSRQSSTTSLSDQKKFKNGNGQVTDPKWDHEAMLYV
ncbi:hypothetical protein G7Y79_00002g007020 [Physcia stellaris]|nr:hypothetical protein G7Y79_00002g007020 [Physcia stellaris]